MLMLFFANSDAWKLILNLAFDVCLLFFTFYVSLSYNWCSLNVLNFLFNLMHLLRSLLDSSARGRRHKSWM